MKKFVIALFLIGSVQMISADNVLKNSDFTEGAVDWHGDGRTPTDLKPTDALDTSAVDYGDKGLVIPLKAHEWTKVVQEFRTENSSLTLHCTYKLVPNTTFSQNDDDYKNVPHQIGFDAWAPFNGKKGGWMMLVSDFTKARIFYHTVLPQMDSANEQSFTDTVNSLVPEDEKTVCLAFPPGTGAVILLHVSLDSN
jgi:hypothetical protein